MWLFQKGAAPPPPVINRRRTSPGRYFHADRQNVHAHERTHGDAAEYVNKRRPHPEAW